MAKASEMARARATPVDSIKWPAAIVGLLVAMSCAFVAVAFADGDVGFLSLSGVALAAVLLPAAGTLYAMRKSSAEFSTAWLGILVVCLLSWVLVAGWVKRMQGIEAMTRDIAEATEVSQRNIAALDAGREVDLGKPPAEPDTGNPFRLARHHFKLNLWQQTDNYRRYLDALDGSEWDRMLDPDTMRDVEERRQTDARFDAAIAAVDAWNARETKNRQALLANIREAGLPDQSLRGLEMRIRGTEQEMNAWAYSEKLLFYRAKAVALVLEVHPWRFRNATVYFDTEAGLYAFQSAQSQLERAMLNKQSVAMQLNRTTNSGTRTLNAPAR